jgi:hypothetical protein
MLEVPLRSGAGRTAEMGSGGAQPKSSRNEVRQIEAVTLVSGTDQAVFRVAPKPFVYRQGMRLRIDIIGRQAFVAEIP